MRAEGSLVSKLLYYNHTDACLCGFWFFVLTLSKNWCKPLHWTPRAGVCCASARRVWQYSDSRKLSAVQTEPFIKFKTTSRIMMGSGYNTPDCLGIFKFSCHEIRKYLVKNVISFHALSHPILPTNLPPPGPSSCPFGQVSRHRAELQANQAVLPHDSLWAPDKSATCLW